MHICMVPAHHDIDAPPLLCFPIELTDEKDSTSAGVDNERGVTSIIWSEDKHHYDYMYYESFSFAYFLSPVSTGWSTPLCQELPSQL